jgi:hypothetical protein
MNFVRYSKFCVALVAAANCAGGINSASAQVTAAVKNHDGVYAVDIVTQQDACDRAYHWTIAVSGGRISSAADALMQASDQIDGRGNVSLAFRRDSTVAHVAGRVKGCAGSGTWSSPTMQCGGSWSAMRQS